MKSVKLDTTTDLCSIYLFRNVTNSSEIKSKLINGELDATVLNADIFQNLSPTKKVTESLKIFGIDKSVTDLIVVVFQDESQEKIQKIQDLIDGDLKDLSELEQITDWSQISKLHGVNKNTDPNILTDLVISKTACKEFLI